jgi:drug/metabolite transporter (DMT)-like permease
MMPRQNNQLVPNLGRFDIAGTLLALSASATFGAIPILAKLAYSAGISVTQLQVTRFVTITMGLAAIALLVVRTARRVTLARMVALTVFGCFVYGPQSLLFFTALKTLPASFVELVFYIYPGLVVLGAWLVYRRPLTLKRGTAVAMCTGGAALVVGLSSVPFQTGVVLAVATP